MKFQISNSRFQNKRRFYFLPFACLFILLITGIAYPQETVIRAKKVTGPLPLDPYHLIWKGASVMEVMLTPQAITKPEIYESMIKKLNAKAIHNGKEIAFLIEWDDKTKDTIVDMDRYSDATALQFPSSIATGKRLGAAYTMGNTDNPVNIWFWKASYQEKSEVGKVYYTTDAFLGGVEAGNPVSESRPTPVGNIIAQGFSTATELDPEKPEFTIDGIGKWKANRWSVVMRRALTGHDKFETNFKEGETISIAFTVWNGSESHRGARKVYSTWNKVSLEK